LLNRSALSSSHYPETPEGVALALMQIIVVMEAASGPPTKAYLLDLYRCLSAARGERSVESRHASINGRG